MAKGGGLLFFLRAYPAACMHAPPCRDGRVWGWNYSKGEWVFMGRQIHSILTPHARIVRALHLHEL